MDIEVRAARMLEDLLRRTHLSAPDEIGKVAADAGRTLGASQVVLYLVDYELGTLTPVPSRDAGDREPLSVPGTVAGRVFAATSISDVAGPGGGRRLWVPLLDGTERLGAMEMTYPDASEPLPEAIVRWSERLAHLVAMLVVTKGAYGDAFELLRRRKPGTIAGELIRGLVPPLVFATEDIVLGALLEPAYDNGGDAFDYALNGEHLHLAVFDAMGHGLTAAGVAAFALSAYRHSRRHGADLAGAYAALDAAIAAQYPETRFATALLARLDVGSGRLRWLSAGHPAPLLFRGGRFVKPLVVAPAPPAGLGLARGAPEVGEEALEPGDQVLLHTDGLSEARRPGGALFTVERLAEFVERQATGGQTAPETLRRLRAAIIDREEGALRDDATALMVEWRGSGQQALLPQTVLDGAPAE